MNSKDDFGSEMIKTVFGNIPNDWKLIDFKDFLKIRSEKSNDEAIVKYSVTNTGIHKRDEKFNKQLAKSSSKFKIIYKNDLVFGMSREILNFGVMKDDIGGVSSAYNVFKIDDSIDPRYLELFIRVWSEYFKDIIKPASREGQGIDKDILLTKQFYLPTNEYLQKFFYVFDTFNEKIRINEQINKNLEKIGHAIFKHCFINFEFPDGDGKPYKSSGGKMIDSELGYIPKNWKIVSVSDAVELNPKLNVDRDTYKIHVPMTGLSKDSMIITKFEIRSGNSGAKFQNYDTLFARITPSTEHGKTGFVQFLDSDEDIAIGSTEFIVMRSKTLNPYYVYCLARYEKLRKHAINSMTGTSGRQRVQNDCFNNFFIAQPDEKVLSWFADLMGPIFQKINLLNEENQNLASIRDSLLPKLISGEIDVSEVKI